MDWHTFLPTKIIENIIDDTFQPTVVTVALLVQCCVCLSSVC